MYFQRSISVSTRFDTPSVFFHCLNKDNNSISSTSEPSNSDFNNNETNNINLNKEKIEKKLNVALELNNTLLFLSKTPKTNLDIEISKKDSDEKFYICKRPNLDVFLHDLKEIAHIYIFSSLEEDLGKLIISNIDPNQLYFEKSFFKNDCIKVGDKLFQKDINIIGTPIQNTLLLDHDKSSIYRKENGISIRSFFGQQTDRELLSTLKYIKILNTFTDVRKVIAEG